MNFRLRTTESTAHILKRLQNRTGLTPNILARLSISLSLLNPDQPELVDPDRKGLEFNRNTLTGEHDFYYKALIRQHAGYYVPEKEYFPDLFNAHLTRGVQLLEQEYNHAGNFNKFLNNLLKLSEDHLLIKE